MVKYWDSIPDNLRDWALEQQLFFTASAPLAGKHINISPKGLPSSTFSIFDPNHAAYVDATGSGNETISHLYENGRITIMFCSFATTPRIMRFFCTGKVVEWDQPLFEPLIGKMGMEKIQGARAVILLDVFKVQTSCGFAVPYLSISSVPPAAAPAPDGPQAPAGLLAVEGGGIPVLKDRETLGHWASKKVSKNDLRAYQAEWNASSLDALPGLRVAMRDAGQRRWVVETKARLRRVVAQREAVAVGILIGMMLLFGLLTAQTMFF